MGLERIPCIRMNPKNLVHEPPAAFVAFALLFPLQARKTSQLQLIANQRAQEEATERDEGGGLYGGFGLGFRV